MFVSLLQLLIGYENGTVVLWDLRSKRADLRAYYDEVRNFHLFRKTVLQQIVICLIKQMDIYIKALLVLEILFVLCFWTSYWQQKSKPEISSSNALGTCERSTTWSLFPLALTSSSASAWGSSVEQCSDELTWHIATLGII